MKNWHLKRIGELGTIVTGKTPSSKKPDEFGSRYPFITPSDIPSTQKYIIVERYLSEKGMAAHRRIKLPPKATCVVCIASIGKTCMTQSLSISNQQINSIIANQHNDSDFIYYLATTLKDSLVAFAGGTATPIVNKSTFSSIKVLVPEKRIQRKIAAVLSAYDDMIENNNRRVFILEKMAEELYREWFVRLRFPGHEKAKFHKGVPLGWDVVKIGDLCFEDRKIIKKKNIPDSTRYIGLEHIPQKSMIIKEYGYSIDVQSDKLLFPARSILFGKIRPYLHKVALVHFDGVCSSDTIVIKPRKAYLEAFIYLTISSDFFIDLATTSSTGTKMPRADWNFLERQNILLPDIDLLNKFQDSFDTKFLAIVNYQQQVEILSNACNRLLTRLMSGKLDVENLDIRFPISMEESIA